MARSKRKPSARQQAEASAPASEDLEDPTTDDAAPEGIDAPEGTDAEDTDDAAATDREQDETAPKRGAEPGKKKRGAEPGKKNGSKDAGGRSTGRTPGGDVPEKAKDAAKSTSPKKSAAAETARTSSGRRVAAVAPNPQWLAPTAVTLLLLGLVYLVAYYLSAGTLPLPIGDWNLAAGFGVMLVGGGMLMFWK